MGFSKGIIPQKAKGEPLMYMICHAILNNEKRIKKVKSLKGSQQREKLRKYVVGECATQGKRLTEDEIYKAAAYIYGKMYDC